MLKSLTVFGFEDKEVRTFGTKLEPWFAAVDVLRALDIHPKNISQVLDRLDDDEKMVIDLGAKADSSVVNFTTEAEVVQGSHNTIWIISEPGMYRIIFRSDKPKAKAFTRWVTHEVLPSIRKRGYYLDPRWGFAPTEDGKWALATGEKLNMYQIRQRAEKLGIDAAPPNELKEIVREINQRESYLAMREKYPYTYDDVDRDYGDVEYYRCFIKDNEDKSIYSKIHGIDEYFSKAFVNLIKRVDKENSYKAI